MSLPTKLIEGIVCGLPTVEICGAFTHAHSEFSEIVLKKISQGHNNIIIDLRRTSFFSSAGLACIIVALKHISAKNGKMFILGPTKDMMNVFQMTLLCKVLYIANDEPELSLLISKEI